MAITNGSGSVVAVLVGLLLCVACQGQIGAGGKPGSEPSADLTPGAGGAAASGGSGSGPKCETTPSAAPLPTRLRRLTPGEYVNTLRALVGEGVVLPAVEFPPDAALGAFHNAAALLRVTDLLASGLAQVAEQLSLSASEQLPALLGCDPAQAGELLCVRGFVERFGARAYRRPLGASEVERLLTIYAQGRNEADPRAGVALVLEVLFQSPHLLYRSELGPREALDAEVTLTAPELASALGYLVTQGPPDAELERAAAAGELMGAEAREAQLRRLLQLPSARGAVATFASDWLGIGKLPTLPKDAQLFPDFSPDAARAMQQATEARFAGAVFEGDGKLRSLLLGGLLVEPSVLSAHAGTQWSSPTHRGKMIRNQLLCQQVPPPPPGLIVTVPAATPGATTRQRMLTHASDPACSGCHLQMDPLGFAFEHFDAVGQYRADENGLGIDASGEISGGTDADGPFDGAAALAQRLAESADVRVCFAKQWTTFALGGEVNEALACALSDVLSDFGAERLSLPDLLVRVVRSEAFVKRHVR